MTDYSKLNNDDGLFIPDKLTPLTEAEAAFYLRKAYTEVVGVEPSVDSWAILWAQSALESGRWVKLHCWNLHCWNFGNTKRVKGEKWTSFKCSEIINGKNEIFYSYHPQTHFGAWEDPLGGAVAYIKFITSRSRYQAAWEQLKKGDAVGYVSALKQGGYFTADLNQYTKAVVSLCNEFRKKVETFLAWKPYEPPQEEPKPEPIQELLNEEKPTEMVPVAEPWWVKLLKLVFSWLKSK